MKKTTEKYTMEPIVPTNAKKVAQAFIDVFSLPPWEEQMKCSDADCSCKAKYSFEEAQKVNNVCPNGQAIIPFWNRETMEELLLTLSTKEDFVGKMLRNQTSVVGFTYGYCLDRKTMVTKLQSWPEDVAILLAQEQLEKQNKLFFANLFDQLNMLSKKSAFQNLQTTGEPENPSTRQTAWPIVYASDTWVTERWKWLGSLLFRSKEIASFAQWYEYLLGRTVSMKQSPLPLWQHLARGYSQLIEYPNDALQRVLFVANLRDIVETTITTLLQKWYNPLYQSLYQDLAQLPSKQRALLSPWANEWINFLASLW